MEVPKRMLEGVLALCLLAGYGGTLPTPSEERPQPLLDEWHQAQEDITRLDPPVVGDPFSVSPSRFVIETEEEPFYCGDFGLHAVLRVYGCFRAEPEGDTLGVIRYYPEKVGALRHEARHAILFALGDARWPDVGH